MRRGGKIAIGLLVALAVLIVLNAVVTTKETKPAEVTVAGGQIVDLPGGDLQVVERGPAEASPIVLLHCYTCSINWWNRLIPRLDGSHRVIAIDMLGHGGSEKPDSGYSMPYQADLVAQALHRLGVCDAEVVGHSLGGAVAVALAERSPDLVNRVVIIDSAPDDSYGDLGFMAGLGHLPVIGPALWRIKPDAAVRSGLEVAFAPGFEVPDEFVEDVDRMTFSSYDDSEADLDDYGNETPLSERMATTGKPLMVIMGSEEQIIDDPQAALDAYAEADPQAVTRLIVGAGHSPNVETPALTASLLLGFSRAGQAAARANSKQPKQTEDRGPFGHEMQDRMQNRSGVRRQP
jgi:pimeloyl-ACP methyl ester carboxylesterase